MKTLGVFLGMGGDQRVLSPLVPEGWQIHVFSWPVPKPGENLADYCSRPEALEMLDCDALLGFSFGALPVIELQKRKLEIPIYLISCGIRSSEINSLLRFPLYRRIISSLPAKKVHDFVYFILGISRKYGKSFRRMLDQVHPETYKWALQHSLNADHQISGSYQRLHGENDRLFPSSAINDAEIVMNAGHLLLRDQPKAVKNWLNKTLNSQG